MKAYLITTGLLFGVLAVLHVWRAFVEWPHSTPSAGFVLGMTALVVVPGALSGWAWRLLRSLSGSRAQRVDEPAPRKDSHGPAA